MKILLDISGTGSLQFPDGRIAAVDYTLVVTQERGMKSGRGSLHGEFSLLHDAFLKGEVRLVTAAGPEAQIIIRQVRMDGADFLTTGPVKVL